MASLRELTSLSRVPHLGHDSPPFRWTARKSRTCFSNVGGTRSRSVWIARDGKQCHRLVLDADGQMDVESVPTTEWRTLSALAQQNACSGEIRRGMPGR